MKSKHLAKADFLRKLASYAKQLYEAGDFTCTEPERVTLSAKMEGFVDAGVSLEVVTSSEAQSIIDKAHLEKFGEGRVARRTRILEEKAFKVEDSNAEQTTALDWGIYDSPAKNRKNK